MLILDGVKPSSELFFSSPSNQAKNLFYYVTCTGLFFYEDTYKMDRENYNSFLIIHIIKGSMKIEYNHISFIANMGETVMINCHKPHKYSSRGNLDTIWFHFDGLNAQLLYKELQVLYNSIVLIKNVPEVVNRIYKIHNIYKLGKKTSEAIQSAYIAHILGEFFKNSSAVNNNQNNVVDKVINYIEENYGQVMPIEELAQIAGLSEYYFSRLFKKQTGYTLHEYIIKTRIINSKILLKSTKMSLREIAYNCGFSNESSFSNTFKKIVNMTPGAFRNTDI